MTDTIWFAMFLIFFTLLVMYGRFSVRIGGAYFHFEGGRFKGRIVSTAASRLNQTTESKESK
jgi:hypothetical protein